MGYAFGGEPAYDARHRVAASDGWPLAIYEYRKRDVLHPQPVLLVHGTNCRYRVYDNGGGFGLAPYLAARGFHVFAIDLRGRGLSAPRRAHHRAAAMVRRGWSLTDFMERDLPRAFELVLSRSGADQLDYVGHSMGGMLAFELLARTQEPRVRRVVALAAADARGMLLPNKLDAASRRVNVGVMLAPFALTSPYTPIHWGSKLGALAFPITPAWTLAAAFNPDNVEPIVAQRFLWHSLAGISARKFCSFGLLYLEARRRVERARYAHPTLLIAAGNDPLVPAHRVREMATRIDHADVRLLELSRAHGFLADYGHTDLLLGRHVEREVFPHIEAYLREPLVQRQGPDVSRAS